MKWFARAGYAARGLIYLAIAVFALLAAFGAGRPAGTRDALSALLSNWFGGALSYALAAGLLFYALWRFTQSLFDADGHGTDLRALAIRGGLLVSGIAYLTLAFYAVSLRRGVRGPDGGGFADMLAGIAGARWAAATLALALAGAGIAHVIKALKERYEERFEAGESAMRVIHPIAKTGLIARGAIFFVLAFLFAVRAWRGSGGKEPSSREALEFVQQLPAGGWLLAGAGVGLVAFSLYSFVEARYRRINFAGAGQQARRAVDAMSG
jgi:hypothetical protein